MCAVFIKKYRKIRKIKKLFLLLTYCFMDGIYVVAEGTLFYNMYAEKVEKGREIPIRKVCLKGVIL